MFLCLFWWSSLCLIVFVETKKPNVVFIIVDDLKPVLGVYDYKKAVTPNIDKLASKSFVFTNAYAQQALCAPSRNSLLTSRRPDTIKLYDFYSYWRQVAGNFKTLPQHFRENGYVTHSIGKVFHPGISSNFTDDAKYSWSFPPYHPPTEIFKNAKVCPTLKSGLENNLNCPVIVEEQPGQSLPDLQSLNEAIEFLTKLRNKTVKSPYFLAVGFHKPHVPFKFPVKYLDYHPLQNVSFPTNRWRSSTLPTVAWNPWTDIRKRHDISLLNVSFPFGPMPDSMARKIIQHYNAATTYIDDLIGQLLAHIEDDTIVVVTSDHGWQRGEHGEFSKFSNYAEATRVPLVMRVPGLSERKVVFSGLVELVDLFPTLVDLTRVSESLESCAKKESELCTEGLSLVPMMYEAVQDGAREFQGKKAIFTQYPRPSDFPRLNPNSDKPKLKDISIMGYTIRTEEFRYTEWVKFNHSTFQADWNSVVAKEFYDLRFDENENLNLGDRPELSDIMERLRKDLMLGWRHFN